jgi:hypothetical protein
MLNLSRVIALAAVMMMTFGSAVQAKELRGAAAKPQVSDQAVESVDFTLYWYV